jgi:hypothetical protein
VTTLALSAGHRGDEVLTDGLAGGSPACAGLCAVARAASPANTLAVTQLELLSALAEHPGVRPG